MPNPTDHIHTDHDAPQATRPPRPMQAIQYDHYGPADVMAIATVDTPTPAAGSALIRVDASSVNAADVDIRSGKLKLLSGRRFPRGTGFDFAGEIVQLGDGVDDLQVGDQVWGFLNGVRQGPSAATAQYVAAPVDRVAPLPVTLDPVGAAALSGAGGAAVGALQAADVKHGDRVLIRGAAGGVGSVAVQIAVAMGGHVTALVRAKHLDRVRELGAQEAFDYNTADPVELGGFDVILDTVGRNMRAFRRLLNPGGRMVAITFGGPGDAAYMIASRLFGKTRIRFVQSPPDRALLDALAARVNDESVVAVIDNVYPPSDIAAAHRAIEAGGAFGKQVIRIDH